MSHRYYEDPILHRFKFRWLLQHQVQLDSNNPRPWPYTQPVWVFTSRALPRPDGADIRFVRGDVRPAHQQMLEAAGDKNIWIVGGGELAGQFYDQGLLDELIVQVASVTLGGGAPLFPRRITNPSLRLTAMTAFGDAFAELRYEIPRE